MPQEFIHSAQPEVGLTQSMATPMRAESKGDPTSDDGDFDDHSSDDADVAEGTAEEFVTGPPIAEGDIRETDVLCGRDKISHSHIGNKHFLGIIKEHRESYQTATSREAKTRLSTEIVTMIRACGGRFLKCDADTGEWCDVGDAVAREKVSHALRSCKDPNRPRVKRPRVVKKYVPSQHENELFDRSVAFLNIFFRKLVDNYNGPFRNVGDPSIMKEALAEFHDTPAGKRHLSASVAGPVSQSKQIDQDGGHTSGSQGVEAPASDADRALAAMILASLASQVSGTEQPEDTTRESPPPTEPVDTPTPELPTSEKQPEPSAGSDLGDSELTNMVTNHDEEERGITVSNNDCLCGRGGLANKHPGNVLFRRLVSYNKELYQSCENKSHKQLLTMSIVATVEQVGGRFLRRDDDTGEWIKISRKEAISKTAQALREQEGKNRKVTQT